MTLGRRLTTSSVLIALAAVLVLGVPLGIVEAARVHSEETGRLEREADAVAGTIDDRLERGVRLDAASIAPLVHRGHRVTVTAGGRTVTAGAHLTGGVVEARSGTSRSATVVAAAPASEIGDRKRRSWLLITALGVGGVAIAFGLASSQARRLSRPLEEVATASARLGEGDFSVRVPRSGVPEVDAIAASLDRSAQRIARLVAREREFSSNVSHQLRTPLTALRLRLEESVRDPESGTLREELEAAVREADRLEATVAALLTYARADSSGRRLPTNLRAAAADHVRTWSAVAARAGRTVTLATEREVSVLASRGTVGQVLDVLIENAVKHGRGPILVEVAAADGWGSVTVEDAGDGIPPEDADRVFDRGATTGDGAGIGLHLARALAASDGGTLRLVRERPPRFELRLRRDAGH